MNCYVRGVHTADIYKNWNTLKTLHSHTPIAALLQIACNVGGFQSKRNLKNELNSICSKCFYYVNDYDWLTKTSMERILELKSLLQNTERKLSSTSSIDEKMNINQTKHSGDHINDKITIQKLYS